MPRALQEILIRSEKLLVSHVIEYLLQSCEGRGFDSSP